MLLFSNTLMERSAFRECLEFAGIDRTPPFNHTKVTVCVLVMIDSDGVKNVSL